MNLLTPQEKRVILFLLTGIVVGSVILILKGYTQLKIAPELIMVKKNITFTAPAQFIEYPRKKTIPAETKPKSQKKRKNRSKKPATKIIWKQTPPLDYINRSGIKGLVMLPGVGKVLADRIVKYRGKHGAFGSIDELDNVSGIGKKKVEKIKAFFAK